MNGLRSRRRTFGAYVVLVSLAVLFLIPLLWTILYALRPSNERNAIPISIIPSRLDFSNFRRALTTIDFFHFLKNSLVLSIIYTTLVTFSSALVGFAFARLRAPGRRHLFTLVLATMMVPTIITIIPTYVLFSRIGLLGNYWPWVFWGLSGSPLMIFLFRQFFAAVPQELEEAALLDGVGYARMFVSIFLPLARPVIAACVVITFTYSWGEFFAPAIFLPPEKTTLAVAIARGYVDKQGRTLPNVLAAGIVFYVLPIVVLFAFAQRMFVRGLMSSGIKG